MAKRKNTDVKTYLSPSDSPINKAEESAVAYNVSFRVEGLPTISNFNFGQIMLSDSSKPETQMTAYEKMNLARLGVSKKGLEKLKDKMEVDYDALAKALSVTRATLINKKGEEKFNTQLSERIVGLADIYSYGYEVFEDPNRFNQWMQRPNRALNGQAPYDLLESQFGREEVKNVIGRIDYGVYS